MAVGAKDATDKKLVKMYANVKTMSENTTSQVDPEQILRTMSMIAMHNKHQIQFNNSAIKRKANIA
jgi:hypothetical protein